MESGPREHLGDAEEVDKNERERVELAAYSCLAGLVLLKTALALEVAFLHDAAVKPLRPAAARDVVKRHLGFGQAQTVHHEPTKSLPRLHQVHVGEPMVQLVSVELAVVGMKRYGHIGNLAPTHARGQEMVPSVEESEEHHKLL